MPTKAYAMQAPASPIDLHAIERRQPSAADVEIDLLSGGDRRTGLRFAWSARGIPCRIEPSPGLDIGSADEPTPRSDAKNRPSIEPTLLGNARADGIHHAAPHRNPTST